MKIKDIYRLLCDDCSMEAYFGGSDYEIIDIEMLDNTQQSYSAHKLYFGYPPEGPLPPQCVLGVQSNAEKPEPQNSSVIFVNAGELFAVFNRTRRALAEEAERTHTVIDETCFLEELKRNTAESGRLTDILNAAAQLLHNPLLITNVKYRVVAYSERTPIRDEVMTRAAVQGLFHYKGIRYLHEHCWTPGDVPEISFVEGCGASPCRKLVCKIAHDGVFAGTLWLMEENCAFSSAHFACMLRLAEYLSQAFDKLIPALSQGETLYQQLLNDLLACASSEEIEEYLPSLKLPPRMLAAFARPARKAKRKNYNEAISNAFPECHGVPWKGGVAMLLSAEDRSLAELRKFAAREGLRIGVSSVFSELLSFPEHLFRAQSTAELMELIYPEEPVGEYHQYRFFDLLQAIDSKDRLTEYMHPVLLQIKEYDASCGTEYFNTLRVYVSNRCELKSSAEALFMHRNSLAYRLERICELFGLDVQDDDTRFLLRMSFFIDDYLQATSRTTRGKQGRQT